MGSSVRKSSSELQARSPASALPLDSSRSLALCAEVPHSPLVQAADGPLGQPTFSWAQPGLEVAAYGEAERREGGALRSLVQSLQTGLEWAEAPATLPPGPWFGAIGFHAALGLSLGDFWQGFAPLRFSLPRLLRWSTDGRHYAAVFGKEGKAALRTRLDQARRLFDVVPQAAQPLDLLKAPGPSRIRVVAGSRERWAALVADALAAIGRGELDKVVLARAVDAIAQGPIETGPLLAALAARFPTCTTFLLRGDDGAAFLGATPETFCRVEKRSVFTDALAGSAAPGSAPSLLKSGKDLREHSWVVAHLQNGLRDLCSELLVPPAPRVRVLANVAHLYTPVEGTLRPGLGTAEVISALHPTPAVLGVPSAAARRFLAAHEGLARGLYAGLIGMIGPERADLKVALRCALVRGDTARLFVGAGVVEGSSADGEWDETALKAAALLGALESPR